MEIYFVFDGKCDKVHKEEHSHFDEETAKDALKGIMYTDRFGIVQTGEHWDLAAVNDATSTLVFPEGTTEWDKWVAYNSIYADLCRVLPDEQLLKVAYEYFFNDEDYRLEGSKIWHYTHAMEE